VVKNRSDCRCAALLARLVFCPDAIRSTREPPVSSRILSFRSRSIAGNDAKRIGLDQYGNEARICRRRFPNPPSGLWVLRKRLTCKRSLEKQNSLPKPMSGRGNQGGFLRVASICPAGLPCKRLRSACPCSTYGNCSAFSSSGRRAKRPEPAAESTNKPPAMAMFL